MGDPHRRLFEFAGRVAPVGGLTTSNREGKEDGSLSTQNTLLHVDFKPQ
ncbi:hypothetical protein AWB67_05547 [Caballeronia terrestris]|jgi:hypothetical protein|uniref:Uncharacterized protein n=1 Tax=Caballeronia terrestris TaxID=1226301 RepID=A0A158KHD9_9BURK|nr:hypothetical protein AWB67_05547 [Caballeronia terrestris]